MQTTSSLLALDVGERRIGVAVAREDVRFAQPLQTLEQSPKIYEEIQDLLMQYNVSTLVVGLPRGLDGQHTAQTSAVEAFVERLKTHLSVPTAFQDEAATSLKAKAELQSRKKPYAKGEVDALAATYILEDYLQEHA